MSIVTVPRQIDELVSKMRVLWDTTRQYTYTELKTNPDGVFVEIIAQVYRLVEMSNARKILVLTPFIYRRYAKKFAEIIRELRKKLGYIEVTVVTRSPEYVNNYYEHKESIEVLKSAGIKVCTVKNSKFHAKAIVIGTTHVIAGSVNMLAPSYDEIIIKVPLIKILENPLSASTLMKIFSSLSCEM